MNRDINSIYTELEEMRWNYRNLTQFGEPNPIGCWGMDDLAENVYHTKKEAWRNKVHELGIAITKLEHEYEVTYYEERAYDLVRLVFGDE